MELHDLVRHEWNDDHMLSKRSVIWIHEHADPGDPIPVVTAIAQLRSEGQGLAALPELPAAGGSSDAPGIQPSVTPPTLRP